MRRAAGVFFFTNRQNRCYIGFIRSPAKTYRKKEERMKKTIKKLALILLIAALMLTVTGCGANDYQTAVQLMGSGDAAAASAAFKALGD